MKIRKQMCDEATSSDHLEVISEGGASSSSPLKVRDAFQGLNFFITGGTGFVGKILVEKLLRSVPGCGKLYLLVREKKGTGAAERVQKDILNSKIFERLRGEREDFAEYVGNKLVAVAGDIQQNGMGIDAGVRAEIQPYIHVVVHCAASVNFREPMIDALNKNVVGSLHALDFSKGCPNLLLHQHVSTAYVSCNRDGWMYEHLYPLKSGDPEEVYHELMRMDAKQREAQKEALLKREGYPNVYTFTKCLTEHLIVRRRGDLPVTFFRPTIIGACHHEPIPGWVDVVSAASSLFITGILGLMRQLHGDGLSVGDQIPGDMVVNAMLVSMAKELRCRKIRIYMIGTSKNRPLTWEWNGRMLFPYILTHPVAPERRIQQPRFHWQGSKALFHIEYFLDYTLPGALYRAYARLFGGEAEKKRARQSIKLEVITKKLHESFGFFISGNWVFDTSNTESLIPLLDAEESREFDFDVRHIEWETYLRWFGWGLRTFLLNAPPDPIPPEDREVKMYLRDGLIGDILFASSRSRKHVVDNLRTTMRERKAMVLFAPAVQQAIQAEAARTGQSAREVAKRAREIINIMTGSIRMPVLRGEALLFHSIYKRYYDAVKVDEAGLVRLRIAARHGLPLVLMPSHRSYMDFLIVSYLFYLFEIPLPHIAAGNDFLAMRVVNWILRHSGAFFMRRSFKGDALYRSVFVSYLQGILRGGSPLEFFMEGTRSRSGKSLTPRLGVLSMLVDLFLHDDSLSDLMLCPITINYERFIEEDAHVRELLGEPKKKMSTAKLLKAFGERAFNAEFGRISIQFGCPVSLRAFLEREHGSLRPQPAAALTTFSAELAATPPTKSAAAAAAAAAAAEAQLIEKTLAVENASSTQPPLLLRLPRLPERQSPHEKGHIQMDASVAAPPVAHTPSAPPAAAAAAQGKKSEFPKEMNLPEFHTLSAEENAEDSVARAAAVTAVADRAAKFTAKQSLLVQELGDLMMERIMEDVVCTATQLVSAILLSQRRGISRGALIERYSWLSQELKRRRGRVDSFQGGAAAACDHALRLLQAAISERAGMLEIAVPVVSHTVQLSIYRNGLLHLLVPDALAVLPLHARGGSVQLPRLLSDVRFLRRLLQREFVLEASSKDDEEEVVRRAASRGLLTVGADGIVRAVRDEASVRMSSFLCESLLPFIDTYWLTAAMLASLSSSSCCGESDLVQRVQWLTGKLGEDSTIGATHAQKYHSRNIEIGDQFRLSYAESASRDTIRHALATFRGWNVYGLRGAKAPVVEGKSSENNASSVNRSVAYVELLPPYNMQENGKASPMNNLVEQIELYRSPPSFVADPSSIIEVVRSFALFAKM